MKTLLKFLLNLYIKIYNFSYQNILKISTKLNDGINPKVNIIKYGNFFLNNIEENSKVLDIGCGIGFLTKLLSKKAKKVIGIDINKESFKFALRNHNNHNIEYIVGDATIYNFKEYFDYIILSNGLEHIKNRKEFLKKIKPLSKVILIRVPMIDRSWLPLYIKNLGLEYRLDQSHYIEYTFKSFKKEIEDSGLKIKSYDIKFGEIWSLIEC